MTARRDAAESAEIMLSAGYEPLDEYRSLKAKWRCRHLLCGREVTPTLGQILRGKGGCKFCARTFVDPIEAVEVMRAAGYEPLEPYVNSGHKWRCQCLQCGKETKPTYDEARIGSRCKFCAKKALHPEDAVALMRSGGFEPLEDYPGSMDPWMCRHIECGEIRFPRYAHVQQGRRACQTCSKKLMAEEFRLDPSDASRVMREAGLEPLEPYPGRNNSPWLCRHLKCGSEVSPTYASIQQGQGGCKRCHQQRLARKYRTPEKQAIEIMRTAGFEPRTTYPGKNHAPWPAIHLACGKEVSPALSNVRNGAGCAYCAERRIDDSDAVKVMERAGLKPLEAFPGRLKPWKCVHLECGREVTPLYSTVRQGNAGCVYCSGGRIHPDDARQLFSSRGFTPVDPFPGTDKPWRSVHECGRQVAPLYSNISTGGGCKFCSDSGFDYDAQGIIYLMNHSEFHAFKIGITTKTARTDRIREHSRHGWKLQHKWETDTGLVAETVETAILGWWRNTLKAPEALTAEQMPSGGHTETIAALYVETDEIIERVSALCDELNSLQDEA